MKHNSKVVEAFFRSYRIPKHETEFRFCPDRKWRFDYAWTKSYQIYNSVRTGYKDVRQEFDVKVALEVEGGVWVGGRHTSGAGFVKDMEKYNEAACLGWRIIRCQPKDLLTAVTANMIMRALGI